ncbi:MAG: 3-dehydroquinate synthase family protein [Acidimicrobiales bacterium]
MTEPAPTEPLPAAPASGAPAAGTPAKAPSGLSRCRVALDERGYDIWTGPGASGMLGDVLPTKARRVAVVTQPELIAAGVLGSGGQRGLVNLPGTVTWRVFEVPRGEAAKSLSTIADLCSDFARFGLTRSDAVVSVGGGVVCDVGGFAGSVYHRGVPVAHVATTLLAQIDAAIGGKCGVNLPEGKNLVGSFWQPAAVLCDTDLLATLPSAEWRSGLGEMAKYAFLGAPDLASLSLPDQVAACAELKASFVASDEREGDRRALLNYGHTLAHALEAWQLAGQGRALLPDGRRPSLPGGQGPVLPDGRRPWLPDGQGQVADGAERPLLRHGEAVAIGLVFAARLARALGRVGDAEVARHVAVVEGLGLSHRLPEGPGAGDLVELMHRDKKRTGAGLSFVLDGPAGLELVSGIAERDVLAVLEESPRDMEASA